MNEIVVQSPYVKKYKKRNITNKNMKTDLLLQYCFNFQYAGKCTVFIHTRRDKFELVHQGVHLVQDIFTFSPNFTARFEFDTLYQAILAFNKTVQILTSSMDWYDPKVYKNNNIYKELFIKD